MMKVQTVLAIVCLTAVGARRPPGPPSGGGGCSGSNGGPPSAEANACRELLMPESEGEEVIEIVETCISDLDLDDILESLGSERHGGRRSPNDLLVDNGYTTEALELRKCVAEALGFVADDDTFDEDAFKASLLEKAEGTEQEEDVELGLESCNTSGFADFEIQEFVKCVTTYCDTGAAP